MAPRLGGCLCGNVRYAAVGEPVSISICHCASCRKSAGAPSVAWAVYELDDFRMIKGVMTVYASSPGVQRGHCGACGTCLTFYELGDETIDITLASLDDPDQLCPTKEIWLSHRLAWEVVSGERTGFEEGTAISD